MGVRIARWNCPTKVNVYHRRTSKGRRSITGRLVGDLPRRCDSGEGYKSPVYDPSGPYTISIQSALLGGIEAVLLVFFNDETNFGATHPSCRCNGPDWVPTTAQKLTLFLIYISLFFSLEAAVTSYALTFEFSMIPSRAARDNLHYHDPKASDWAILQHYGLKNWVNLIWIHCRNSIHSN